MVDDTPASLCDHMQPQGLKRGKLAPVLDVTMLRGAPLGCHEGVVGVVDDLALPESDHGSLPLRQVPRAAAANPALCKIRILQNRQSLKCPFQALSTFC